ncbi:hypothetical protein BG52_02150 [Paenibacillus darwinianus]|nr:hypothetical protein BG52_02150 [Paenibacillus darwinianus]
MLSVISSSSYFGSSPVSFRPVKVLCPDALIIVSFLDATELFQSIHSRETRASDFDPEAADTPAVRFRAAYKRRIRAAIDQPSLNPPRHHGFDIIGHDDVVGHAGKQRAIYKYTITFGLHTALPFCSGL